MAIRHNELVKNIEVLKEEYLGWDNVEKWTHLDNGVYSTITECCEQYFIEATFKGQKVYFIKKEYKKDKKVLRVNFIRTDKNQNVIDLQGEDEWIDEKGKLRNDNIWYDL